MSLVDTLNFASRQLNIYVGLCALIFGVVGGILNTIIFTTLRTLRETTCAFYLTFVSVINIILLLTALLIRVLSEGFNTDIRRTSWVCKLQIYIVTWSTLVSLTGMCFATVDQYVLMSKYRRFSHLRFARRCVFISIIFWGIYSISFFLYWDAPFGTCTIINKSFAIYVAHFHFLVLYGVLPTLIMITFALLAFRSTRTLASRQVNIVRLSRDRQLTAMTLIHVVYVVLTVLPFCIYFPYYTDETSQDPEQIACNKLIYSVTVLIDYSSFAGSFYIYCCVSERFRKQLIHVLTKLCIDRRQAWNNNRIVPHIQIIADAQPRNTNMVNCEVESVLLLFVLRCEYNLF